MDKKYIKDYIARRTAQELKDGYVVNLGVGLPTLCTKYLPEGVRVCIDAELGIVGQGATPVPGTPEYDPMNVVDAGGSPATVAYGGSFTDSATNFGLIRGGHVDAVVLGCMEVDEKGNIANWIIPGKSMAGMGGAMDLCNGAKEVIVAMAHTAKGNAKILKKCKLPLTASHCVTDIITEMAFMKVTSEGIVLKEYNPELGTKEEAIEKIQAATEATLIIDPELKPMEGDLESLKV
jgi:acetate CoA/acetoacetate CoA-transferase beta subunit